MKVSHEVPICLFKESLNFNDYDYCLCHLLKENEEYYKFYKNRNKDRMLILDNSVFELGEAFDMEDFLKCINDIRPSHYIIPDVLDDAENTIKNIEYWNKEYKSRINYNAKAIGVVQGNILEEAVYCYKSIESLVDTIAISFNSSYYDNNYNSLKEKLNNWMIGRYEFIKHLITNNIINTNKEHHLLGCALPQEFALYNDINFITSCDTSNPVVQGLYNIRYSEYGIETKNETKLCDLITISLTQEQYDCIMYNIKMFKKLKNRLA